MKLLILAAGYATRLYPLTLNQPKPLLPVAGRPMIDHVIDAILAVGNIDEVMVVTNAKFTPHFEAWAQNRKTTEAPTIRVLNDRSTDDTNKLGAIGDIHFAMDQANLEDDLIVVAGDNLFSEKLSGFGDYCRMRRAPVLGVYDVGDLEAIKKYNSISLDSHGRITFFEEKPKDPTSTLTGIALYYYPKEFLGWIHRYMEGKNNPDQPGRLIQWLYPQTAVYTWKVPGIWYDIGSKESLAEADKVFSTRSQ
jgi:glucose-1-phosphate thymidylyltransferase